jgi:tetratricopeptide (TPR) repeat protein
VLTEATVIIFGALVALGLALVGALELLWRSRGTPDAESGEPRRRWRSSHPRHAAGARERYLKPAQPSKAPPIRPPQSTQPVAAVARAEITSAPATAIAIVDRCLELYQAQRHADVVATANAALAADAPVERRPASAHDSAALWSLVGLAQQALGDHAAARAALETAIATAPDAERPKYRCQLATLALAVARDLVAAADAPAAPDSEARVSSLRDALVWLERAHAAAPDDPELRELTVTAETRLWPAYEQLVLALLQHQEFRAARRLLHEALERPGVPPARAETFRELFSGTFSGEIGQLTAQAIRSMQEARESEALGALERAERLLESVHDEALPPKRREEVDRRLWWGYNKLGRRRVDAGAFEAAIDPLVRALRLAEAAPDRQAETRGALVRAFEGWTEASALAIREVADAGDREAALVRSDKLWTRLRAALHEGLSEQDLGVAFARVRRLFEEIGRP